MTAGDDFFMDIFGDNIDCWLFEEEDSEGKRDEEEGAHEAI